MNTNVRRRSNPVSTITSLLFENSTTSHSLNFLTTLLKTKLSRNQNWNGKVLSCVLPCNRIQSTIAIYDVFKEKIDKTIIVPFNATQMIPNRTNNEYIVITTDNTIHILDKDLSYSRIVYTAVSGIHKLALLRNGTIAVGMDNGLNIFNNEWKLVVHVKTESIYDIVQLKNGSVAAVTSYNVILWDETFNKMLRYVARSSFRIAEFAPNIAYTFDRKVTRVDTVAENAIQLQGEWNAMYQLQNGWIVAFGDKYFSVFEGDVKFYDYKCGLQSTWKGAIDEVQPGVIGFQCSNDTEIMLFDVHRRTPLVGYPRKFCDCNARLRYFLRDA